MGEDGSNALPQGVRDLVADRLDLLAPDERSTVELIAHGAQGLPHDLLEHVGGIEPGRAAGGGSPPGRSGPGGPGRGRSGGHLSPRPPAHPGTRGGRVARRRRPAGPRPAGSDHAKLCGPGISTGSPTTTRGAGREVDDDRALDVLLEAGERAHGLAAHDEAARHFGAALPLIRDGKRPELLAHVLERMGESWEPLGETAAAMEVWSEAVAELERAGDVRGVARSRRRLAFAAQAGGDMHRCPAPPHRRDRRPARAAALRRAGRPLRRPAVHRHPADRPGSGAGGGHRAGPPRPGARIRPGDGGGAAGRGLAVGGGRAPGRGSRADARKKRPGSPPRPANGSWPDEPTVSWPGSRSSPATTRPCAITARPRSTSTTASATPRIESGPLLQLSYAALFAGHFDESVSLAEEAVAHARRYDQRRAQAMALGPLALARDPSGRPGRRRGVPGRGPPGVPAGRRRIPAGAGIGRLGRGDARPSNAATPPRVTASVGASCTCP